MKTLELKRPDTGIPSTGKRPLNTQGEGGKGSPLYTSWGDHPQAFLPIPLTEPCIPCCTTL